MSSNASHRVLLAGLRLLPKNLVSRLAGHAAGLRFPSPVQERIVRGFGRLAGVNFEEVRDPLSSFGSLQDFFTRALVDGARPIDPAPGAFVSPCDGAWGMAGTVEEGTLLQVKGRPYSVAALLGDSDEAFRFDGGAFATLYLSPKDYHRFHMPCAARVVRASHQPGALWPVNRAGVEGVDGLFARNERVCAFCEVERPGGGGGRLAIVAVGATMVGKVRVTFDDLTTNLARARPETHTYPGGHDFAKGQEWGRFEFGSTLVVLAERGLVELDVQAAGTPLRLGRRIGSLWPGSRRGEV